MNEFLSRKLSRKWNEPIGRAPRRERRVSTASSHGYSFGLEFPYRYEEDYNRRVPTYIVFNYRDGRVIREFTGSMVLGTKPIDLLGNRWKPDRDQLRFRAQEAASAYCRDLNGLSDGVSADVLAEIDATE